MITHKLLYNSFLHKTLFVLAITSVAFISSCKSKKAAATVVNPGDESTVVESKEILELRFTNLFISACSERMKGNLKDALNFLDECNKINPHSAPLHFEFATVYKLQGAKEMALFHAQEAASKDPKNEWYQLLLIECLIQAKKYPQAIKVREGLVKNFPQKSEYKEELAIDYAIVGQYDKAIKIYSELEKAFGVNEQLTLNKVKLLKSQKKTVEIEYEFKNLIASFPDETRFQGYLAEYYMEQQQFEKAKPLYDKVISDEPNNPTVNLALHDYYQLKSDYQMAFFHLKKAIENPDLELGIKTEIIGQYYKRSEMNDKDAFEKGEELAKIFLSVHPKATESNALYADFLRLQNKLLEASKYYYTACINNRQNFRIWENLLLLENQTSQYDSLQKHSQIAMELFPSSPLNYLLNGVANMQLKNYQKATTSLGDGLELVVANKSLMLDFLSSLGDAYYNLTEYSKSDKAFEDALKIDSDNTYVLNNYAYYLSLRNVQLEKAEKLSKRTLELKPNDRNYMDTYGWILYQQKNYLQAEEWLNKAGKLGSKNPNILEHHGDALYKLGKIEEAIVKWNEAVEAGASSKELQLKIKNRKTND